MMLTNQEPNAADRLSDEDMLAIGQRLSFIEALRSSTNVSLDYSALADDAIALYKHARIQDLSIGVKVEGTF